MEELLDNEGYPTEYTLEKIKNWEIRGDHDFLEIMEFIKSVWHYPPYVTKEGNVYILVTLGWSGNEDIIGAMEQNLRLHAFYWYSSQRGGKYIYAPINYDAPISWIVNK